MKVEMQGPQYPNFLPQLRKDPGRPGRIHPALLVGLVILLLWSCAPGGADDTGTKDRNVQTPWRVACVGDSLTYGAGLDARDRDAYPAQLGRMLGPDWEVRNFGWSGTTALMASRGTKAGLPYRGQPPFEEALAFEPHVVLMQFGTNDADPALWRQHKDAFKKDYRAMIRCFASLPSKPRIWLCFPTPLVPQGKNLRLKNLKDEVLPRIRELAEEEGLSLIDFFRPLKGRWELFPDKAHPNAEGARLLADAVFEALKGHEFEESEKSDP